MLLVKYSISLTAGTLQQADKLLAKVVGADGADEEGGITEPSEGTGDVGWSATRVWCPAHGVLISM